MERPYGRDDLEWIGAKLLGHVTFIWVYFICSIKGGHRMHVLLRRRCMVHRDVRKSADINIFTAIKCAWLVNELLILQNFFYSFGVSL